MSTLQGTTIKNTGYLDKVYFNTSIPTEEVIDILEKLTYTSGSYDVCYGTNGVRVNIAKHDSYYSIACAKDKFYDMPFNTDPQYVNEIAGIVSTGWKTSFDNEGFGNPFEFNAELSSTDSVGNTVGSQNELLKNLISSTPFVESPTLDEFLTDIADSIRYVKDTEEKINAQNYSSEIRKFKGGTGSSIPVDNGAIYEGKYRVRYFDTDGTILKIEYVESGGRTTPPTAPSYDPDYLIFVEWNYDTDNYIVEHPTDIGAIYDTVDDVTYMFCRFTNNTGLNPTLAITGATSIDWGDGSINSKVYHTYANEGDYEIKIYGDISISASGTKQLLGNLNLNRTLQKIYIKNGITSIGDRVFYACNSLTNITIPKSVISIGNYVFNECFNLTNITIPEGVTSIGNYTFSKCYSLTNITIPEGVTSIKQYAFDTCYSLTNITIPEGVTSIDNYAFNACNSLIDITIPEGVTSIGDNAFYLCNSLTNITIPKSVTSIGPSAFSICYSLTNITIPEGVTNIRGNTYSNCYSATDIFIKCDTIPSLPYTSAFNNISKAAIMWVKDSYIEELKVATNWSTYATYMKPLSWYPSLTNPNE